MDEEAVPLDADELMQMGDRIDTLPSAAAEWVGRLFRECLRARMHEAELLGGSSLVAGPDAPSDDRNRLEIHAAQIALDAAEWLKTLWEVGYMGAGNLPARPCTAFPRIDLEDVLNSSLFARIRQGKRPLPFPPPTRHGLPWHELVEGPVKEFVVTAEILGEPATHVLIEGCAEWRIVEEIAPGRAYIVQHRGNGPRYELGFTGPAATLKREAPRWTREIRLQQRGGVRTFTLMWPQADGGVAHVPLRAATWDRAESEAAYWIARHCPQMYGQIRFERVEAG